MNHRPALSLRALIRAGAVSLAVVAALATGAPHASAAPTPSPVAVSVDSSHVELSLWPKENFAPLPGVVPQDPATHGGARHPLDITFGGSTVRLYLPPQVDGSAMTVELALAPTEDPATGTRAYTTDAAAPADQLVVNDLGGGWYEVVMPTDDGVSGPYGRLSFSGIRPAAGVGPEVVVIDPLVYSLHFTAPTGGLLQYAVPQLVARPVQPCEVQAATDCATVPAGGQLDLTVPAGSSLRALGLGEYEPPFRSTSLEVLDANGQPTGEVVAVDVRADAAGHHVVVPADTRPGRYRLSTLLGVPSTLPGDDLSVPAQMSVTTMPIRVTPSLNAGLRSDTGWVEAAPETGGNWSLVGLGGAMVLASAGVGAAVVRSRRASH